MQRTNTPSDRLYIAEDVVQTSQSRTTPVISSSTSSSPVQTVQKVINHNSNNSTFQTHVVPNNSRTVIQQSSEHPNPRTTVQQSTTITKMVQSTRATANVTTKNSTPNVQFVEVQQKGGQRETHLVEIAHDNGTNAVPSHNHAAFPSNVPNHVNIKLSILIFG